MRPLPPLSPLLSLLLPGRVAHFNHGERNNVSAGRKTRGEGSMYLYDCLFAFQQLTKEDEYISGIPQRNEESTNTVTLRCRGSHVSSSTIRFPSGNDGRRVPGGILYIQVIHGTTHGVQEYF